jgi:hypothetical protein
LPLHPTCANLSNRGVEFRSASGRVGYQKGSLRFCTPASWLAVKAVNARVTYQALPR